MRVHALDFSDPQLSFSSSCVAKVFNEAKTEQRCLDACKLYVHPRLQRNRSEFCHSPAKHILKAKTVAFAMAAIMKNAAPVGELLPVTLIRMHR